MTGPANGSVRLARAYRPTPEIAAESQRAIIELLREFDIPIGASDMLLIGTGALHVCGIPARPTIDLDFLVRRLPAGRLEDALAPLDGHEGIRRYADHVFGIMIGKSIECDLIAPNPRGVHEALLNPLFDHAIGFGNLWCAAPEDVFALKIAALADRVVRGGAPTRVEKHQCDVIEVARYIELDAAVGRIQLLLGGYEAKIHETALALLSYLQSHGTLDGAYRSAVQS